MLYPEVIHKFFKPVIHNKFEIFAILYGGTRRGVIGWAGSERLGRPYPEIGYTRIGLGIRFLGLLVGCMPGLK